MSRVGKLPVVLPEGTTAFLEGEKKLIVKGPKGELSIILPKGISAKVEDSSIILTFKEERKGDTAIFGTMRSLIANMAKGVSSGWSKEMELVGTGYRAEVSGTTLVLTVGYSHPVKITAPQGIAFKVEKSIITIEGPDKEIVGQLAAKIRFVRPPEPYKGKGIKYRDEVIRKKAGKAAKAIGGAPGA